MVGTAPGSTQGCRANHTDNMPGIYEDPKRGPCCAHCGGDLGVVGPMSEPGSGNLGEGA